MNAVEAGRTDLRDLTRQLRRAIKRKGAPEWSCSLEVFLIYLRPGRTKEDHLARAGVGMVMPDFTQIRRRFQRLLIHVRRSPVVPLIAHRSRAPIARPNGLTGTAGLRVIHNMCPFWRAWYRCNLLRGDTDKAPTWPSYTTPPPGGCHRRQQMHDGTVSSLPQAAHQNAARLH